jgi:hypothetical protein
VFTMWEATCNGAGCCFADLTTCLAGWMRVRVSLVAGGLGVSRHKVLLAAVIISVDMHCCVKVCP